MRFIYFGSSYFSRFVLETIYSKNFVPSLIVSQPDRPKGRGLKLVPTPISLFALSKNIQLIKPGTLKDSELINQLKAENPDFIIVADYGKILPLSLLSVPKIFPLAVHPSLLPRYRGPAPINWALINGDKETGVTIFKINEKIDEGEIILQKKILIENHDNAITLLEKLACEGGDLLAETIKKINANQYKLMPQTGKDCSYDPKLKKTDGKINWQLDAVKINNLIRGTLGWPSAYAYFNGKILKLLEADVSNQETTFTPGTIIDINNDNIGVATAGGILKIKKLKPEGKNEMSAAAFTCGHKIKVGDKLQ